MAQGISAGGRLAKRQDLPKVSTGIAGLDLILGGGVPAGRVTILSGGPGSGKSTIGLQCLLHGAAIGNPGILPCFYPLNGADSLEVMDTSCGSCCQRAQPERGQ